MSTLFSESRSDLDSLKTLDVETKEPPKERVGSPEAVRVTHKKLSELDSDGSFNRSLIDQMDDYEPPHDSDELDNKGQGERFNITTGEGPAIMSEAVSAYMDIYTTPKVLAKIPLTDDVDKQQAETWSNILAEEYTKMDRSDDASVANHLLLSKTYCKHGVAIPYFDDKDTMSYTVGGLDHFKFPRKTGIVSSGVELCTAEGSYGVTALYGKIEGDSDSHWDKEAVKQAIVNAGKDSNNKDWTNWEEIQRDLKANEVLVDAVCEEVEVIHCWVKEFDGKISYYIASKTALCNDKDIKENFLFKARGFYDHIDQAMQLFAFSVGNGGRLYTVRGLGYLIYQLCNAMDVMHCKMLDNARVGSSLILQPATTEDQQDMMIIDAGSAIMLPPGMNIPDRQVGINLNNALIPAINASRSILDRATGGLAAGNMINNPESDRRTKLEVSTQLDFINKLNSFAVNLFYGPYDKITREKVRRAYTVRQKDPIAAARTNSMMERCMARGVPKEIFNKIDFERVVATRIIGTGSRASRIMLMEQIQQGYSTWDAVGRKRFDYDRLMELGGVDMADRYAGAPEEQRVPYDDAIARLENFQLLEGDVIEPQDGQMHMIHLPIHIEALQVGLQSVEEGRIDLMEWTMEHQALYQHGINTLEMTVVHESVQPELNGYHQSLQQIGEIVVNGMKMINKAVKDGEMEDQKAEEEGNEMDAAEQKLQHELKASELKHKQKMQQEIEKGLIQLANIKKNSEAKQVAAAQEAMSKVVSKSAEAQAELDRVKATMV